MATIIPMRNSESGNQTKSVPETTTNTAKLCKADCMDIFDKPCFLEMLRQEQHRARRSGSKLSILLFKVDATDNQISNAIVRLQHVIKLILRETDIIGILEINTIGVLLPYTDNIGVGFIEKKIQSQFKDAELSITSATFPDQIFESLTKNGCVSDDVLQIMLEDTISYSAFSMGLKRVFDIFGALIALLILSPLMFGAAVAIKLDSPGPIIFKQFRLGRKGKPFPFYKFRSMLANNDDQVHREFVLKLIDGKHGEINHGDKDSPIYKLKSDSRITKVGKIIRKTSIDELPQLYNVLIGDMSLVGPRPPLGYEAEKYKTWHLRRILEMKPGITGLWQVEGRSRTEFNDAVRLDLRYLQTWSFLLDIKILFKTVKEVFACRGAV